MAGALGKEMDRDRNLLFGVLAVQLGKVSADEFVTCAAAWATDPAQSIATRLSDSGTITSSDIELIMRLVDGAVDRHRPGSSNDVQPDLEFGGDLRGMSAELSANFPGVVESQGRYTLGKLHCKGGMGRIVKVHDRLLGRDIALKELNQKVPPESAKRDAAMMERLGRFLKEARITGQLEHPSIVPIYELGQRPDGTPYYTMKFVKGKTFTEVIDGCNTLEERLALLHHYVGLCNAVAYAHSRGVVHRDLKPENVMVGEFGETVVIDWGLAATKDSELAEEDEAKTILNLHESFTDADSTKTVDGQILGTPAYMPPEQARGEMSKVNERSDVYSLGAILYKVITGEAPFKGKRASEILENVIQRDPDDIHERCPAAPRELVAICERAMAKEPRRRFASAKELVNEIQRFQMGARVQTYEYSVNEVMVRFVKRHRVPFVVATAAMVILSVFAVFYQVRLIESRDKEHRNRLLAEAAQEQERMARESESREKVRAQREQTFALMALAKEKIDENRFSEARALLAQCPAEFRHWEWSLLQRLCDSGLHTSETYGGPVTALAFNPANGQLAAGAADGSVTLWPWDNEEAKHRYELHAERLNALAFTNDGREFVTAGDDGTVIRWDAETGERLGRVAKLSRPIYTLALSGDGALVAGAGADDTIHVWELQSGERVRQLRGHLNDVTALAFFPSGRILASGSRDDTVRTWDLSTGAQISVYSDHQNDITAVAVDPSGERIFSGSLDGTVRAWTAVTGKNLLRIRESSAITRLRHSPDGRFLAVATEDDGIAVRNAETGDFIRPFKGHDGRVNTIAFSPDGALLASGGEDRTTRIWDVSNEYRTAKLHVAPSATRFVKFTGTPDGKRVVAAGNTGELYVWDAGRESNLRRIASETIDAMEISENGRYLVSLRSSVSLTVWDLDNGDEIYSEQNPGLYSAALDALGARLAVGMRDGTIHVTNVESKAVQQVESIHEDAITALAFSPDGRYLASGSLGPKAQVWDLRHAAERIAIDVTAPTNDIVYSPDGNLLVTVGRENAAWDTLTGIQRFAFSDTSAETTSAAIAPDGLRIVTGNAEGAIRVWDMDDGRELVAHETHDGYIESLRFSDDGLTLMTVGQTKRAGDTLVAWNVPSWRADLVHTIGAFSHPSEPKLPEHWDDFERAVREELVVASANDAGNTLEPHEYIVSRTEFNLILKLAASVLKANRDEQEYRGKPFASQGIPIYDDPSMRSFAQLGIHPGDVITHLNDVALDSYDAAIETLKRTELEDRAKLSVRLVRNTDRLTLRIVRETPADTVSRLDNATEAADSLAVGHRL